MSKNSKSESRFERLKTGLEEGIQFARGELDLRTTVIPTLAGIPVRRRARKKKVNRKSRKIKARVGALARREQT